MRTVIISDTHFGDPSCSLVERQADGSYVIGPKFEALQQQAGVDTDYLVIVGDLFDFAIAGWQGAYEAARVFFRAVRAEGLSREVVYVPGNHDFSFWLIAMHEFDVINRVKTCKPSLDRRWSVPAVLDHRPGSANRIVLPYVTDRPGEGSAGWTPYGGSFLDSLAKNDTCDAPLVFNVAYPNLYLVREGGETVLVTHGHYLEGFWALGGELAREIAAEDLRAAGDLPPEIESLVSINFPLNELGSSGIGQAGALTAVARAVQNDVKAGRMDRVSRYLDGLQRWISRQADLGPVGAFVLRRILDWLKSKAIGAIHGGKTAARADEAFLQRKEVEGRLGPMLAGGQAEIARMQAQTGVAVPADISRVLFGHTHVVIPWGNPQSVQVGTKSMQFCNTGGWLWPPDGSRPPFVGAEVFIFDSERHQELSVTV